jgi:hypothetical protein
VRFRGWHGARSAAPDPHAAGVAGGHGDAAATDADDVGPHRFELEALEHGAQHDLDLELGQRGAQASVRAAAEGEERVRVGIARRVEEALASGSA